MMATDADEAANWIEQIVATSESEPPEETAVRLFGPNPGLERLETAFIDHAVSIEATDYFLMEETRHTIHFKDRVEHVPCVADALQVAVMLEHDPVTIRSTDPVSGTTVTFEVGTDSFDVRPETHVISLGFSRELVEALPASENVVTFTAAVMGTGDLETALEDSRAVCDPVGDVTEYDFRSLGCRYINAFESPETYREWAEAVDAVSVALPAGAILPGTRAFVGSEIFD